MLVSDRPVVLLDEPTAHLDAATEAVLARVIGELAQSRTVIVVAHRPALVELADRVLTLAALRVPPPPARPAVAALPDAGDWRRRVAPTSAPSRSARSRPPRASP